MPHPSSLALCLIIAVSASATAATPDDSALMAPVQRLVTAINHAAATVPNNVFTGDATVLDDFPPYRWSGRKNADDWYRELVGTDAAARAGFLALNCQLSVGRPQFSRVAGDAAYFALPGVLVFTGDGGKRIRQTAEWLLTETKIHGTWLISGHAWAITAETVITSR
jgi:hypothetical protein